jgi:pyroglutamyl-peptidase
VKREHKEIRSQPPRTRVLVTGFSVFPGAPVNPSERLVQLLNERQPELGRGASLEAALLGTDYQTVGKVMSAIGRSRHPDVALHFGLAREARGFRLERAARNRVSRARPDVAGYLPPDDLICQGPDSYASSLPLDEIASQLAALDLPFEISEDAGEYLCNFTFYNARAGRFENFRPAMCGFIHIPYLDHQLQSVPGGETLPRLSEEQLWSGAVAIIAACVSAVSLSSRASLPRG